MHVCAYLFVGQLSGSLSFWGDRRQEVYWGYVWSGSFSFFVNSAEAVVFDSWVPRTSEVRVCVVKDVMST